MKRIQKCLLVLYVMLHTTQVFSQRFTSPVFQRNQVNVIENVKFGSNYDFRNDPIDGEVSDQFMRIYEPNQGVDTLAKRPVFIYAHTGNFLPAGFNSPTGGIDDSLVVELCTQWAERGFVAVSPSYRVGWNPQALQEEIRRSSLLKAVYRGIIDMKSVVRFLRKSYYEDGNPYNIDPDRIVLFGEGTGGYIVLAYGALSSYSELLLPKFRDFTTVPPKPYVDTLEAGNIDGIGGTKNISNHPNYSSKVNMIINAGGALADNSWINKGEAPVVSFHSVRDPFAPYGEGTVYVPVQPPQIVVDVVGAGIYQATVNSFDNNCAFDDVSEFNDPYSVKARSLYNTTVDYIEASQPTINIGSGEGLFPIILPIDNTDKFKNQASPWQWWSTSHPKHNDGLNSNPDMSKAKAMAYVDTIQGYGLPRVYKVLNLSDLSEGPNRCNETTSVFNTFKQTSSVSIYPNPSNNRFFVELSGSDRFISKVQLMDITGKVVYTQNANNASRMMVVENNFSSGVYFANIHLDNGQQATRKVIIE